LGKIRLILALNFVNGFCCILDVFSLLISKLFQASCSFFREASALALSCSATASPGVGGLEAGSAGKTVGLKLVVLAIVVSKLVVVLVLMDLLSKVMVLVLMVSKLLLLVKHLLAKK